jgi:hypothetical protein
MDGGYFAQLAGAAASAGSVRCGASAHPVVPHLRITGATGTSGMSASASGAWVRVASASQWADVAEARLVGEVLPELPGTAQAGLRQQLPAA